MKSIRNILPNAQIVFSTWKNEELNGLDYDILVQSDDPGGHEEIDGGNVNRQICSRREGILAAEREFVLAIRSESILLNKDFLKYWDKYCCYSSDQEYRYLESRVIIPAIMPVCRAKIFHMGDWYYFGQREDVLKVWDLPYWNPGTFNQNSDDLVYNPHRFVMTQFVKKFHELNFEKKTDINKNNAEICEMVIANNFVVTGYAQYGIDSLKYFYEKDFKWRINQMEVCYSHSEWQYLYNKYCDGDALIKRDMEECVILNLILPIKRVSRKIKRLVKRAIYCVLGKKQEINFYEM